MGSPRFLGKPIHSSPRVMSHLGIPEVRDRAGLYGSRWAVLASRRHGLTVRMEDMTIALAFFWRGSCRIDRLARRIAA
jgi:hypothetical protein